MHSAPIIMTRLNPAIAPVAKFKHGGIESAVWPNQTEKCTM